MVNIRKLKQALLDHKYNVENMEVENIQDSFDRLEDEAWNAIEVFENLVGDVKEE